VHIQKERFPEQKRYKLMPRGDEPFQILERINDNAYKVDIQVSMMLILLLMFMIFLYLM